MKLYTGDRVIDARGRCLCLAHRAKVAGQKGWIACPVTKEKIRRGHAAVVLDTEIRAVIGANGQFILAR